MLKEITFLKQLCALLIPQASHDNLQSFFALTKHRTPHGPVDPYRISVGFLFNCFIHVFMVPYSHQLPRLSLTQATVPPTIRSVQRLALELSAFLNIFLVVILPYVWCLMLVFHSPTDTAPPRQFLLQSKLFISSLGLIIFVVVTSRWI